MPLDELSIIDRFFRPLAGKGAFNLLDDAAQLDVPPASDLVITTDMVAESVHFLPDDPPETIARKALRVNLSDLAAKGARPLAYVLSLALRSDVAEGWLERFAKGLKSDQDEFGIVLLGGDTIGVPDRTVASITAFGAAPRARMVHRSGGRPGDVLFVSGSVGGGGAGLALLKGEAGPWDALPRSERDTLIARYRVPQPRVALAPVVAEFARAAMDVSDGLVGDCDKLCAASGCTAEIDADAVPLAGELRAVAADGLVARLLTSGDDYEILTAVPVERADAYTIAARNVGVQVSPIGSLLEGRAPVKVNVRGRPLALTRRAFVHAAAGADG